MTLEYGFVQLCDKTEACIEHICCILKHGNCLERNCHHLGDDWRSRHSFHGTWFLLERTTKKNYDYVDMGIWQYFLDNELNETITPRKPLTVFVTTIKFKLSSKN